MSSALDHSTTSAILHICGLFPGNNNRHLTCTPWKIILFLAFILINRYIVKNIPADRIIGNIKRKLI